MYFVWIKIPLHKDIKNPENPEIQKAVGFLDKQSNTVLKYLNKFI
jgi:hypothetical protein